MTDPKAVMFLVPSLDGEMEVSMIKNKNEYCVYKASPGGIRKPLYYGSERDCRRFCETKDYEYIDEQQVVWYLEIGSCDEECENGVINTPASA